ncbi:hypothetical protein ACFSFW_06935 [Fredinandcohnia salidurans]|uniref:C1q domain-containing protein n=1 Tax=Fredinandcohnia salidurans TaxID=2595041 RepID=A0ABW4MKG8_9BACI
MSCSDFCCSGFHSKSHQKHDDKGKTSSVGNIVNINVKCDDCRKKEEEIQSAFRANKIDVQPINANTPLLVTFTDEDFDLGNEYNGISTFIPRQDGVYQINASVLFLPFDFVTPYRLEMYLQVDDGIKNETIAADALGGTFRTIVSVSSIYRLRAGNRVTVVVFTNINGQLISFANTITSHFDAARFPFKTSFPPNFSQFSQTSRTDNENNPASLQYNFNNLIDSN